MWKYYKIDVEQFLIDSHGWKKEISELNEKIKEETTEEEQSVQYSIYGEQESIKIEKCSERGEEYKKRIKQIERFEYLKMIAISSISQKELDCIEAFYGSMKEIDEEHNGHEILMDEVYEAEHRKDRVIHSPEDVMKKYGLSTIWNVYDNRKTAITRIRESLESMEVNNELEEFCHFDIQRFLMDASGWQKKLREKKAMLVYDSGISSISQDSAGGRSSLPGNPTLRKVISNEKIQWEIEMLEANVYILHDAIKQLLPIERDLIYVNYLPRGESKYKTQTIRTESVAKRYYVSFRTANRKLAEAKEKMRLYIEEEYFGKNDGNIGT